MSDTGPTRSKVARLIEEYGLAGLGDELEGRWTREENRASLRELTEYFNRQLLEAALRAQNADPGATEVETLYRQLTDDDVSSGVRTQARDRIRRAGIDVDRLEDEFVSRQAIHTYLKKYRDASPPEEDVSDPERRSRKAETIQRLKHRLIAVAERSLTDLKNGNRLVLGEFDVLVNVRVHCTDCGTQRSVRTLLEEGGCNCDRDDR